MTVSLPGFRITPSPSEGTCAVCLEKWSPSDEAVAHEQGEGAALHPFHKRCGADLLEEWWLGNGEFGLTPALPCPCCNQAILRRDAPECVSYSTRCITSLINTGRLTQERALLRIRPIFERAHALQKSAQAADFSEARRLFEWMTESRLFLVRAPDRPQHVWMQAQLANMYFFGEGGAKREDAARALLEDIRDKKQGNPITLAESQLRLAAMYRNGRGGERRETDARTLLQEIAEAELAPTHVRDEAQLSLSQMYQQGIGGAQQEAEARNILNNLVSRRDATYEVLGKATLILAGMCAGGQGGPLDVARAIRLLEDLASRREIDPVVCSKARLQLAGLYLSSKEMGKQGRDKAFQLLEQVVQCPRTSPRYIAIAKLDLARLYADGMRGQEGMKNARELFEFLSRPDAQIDTRIQRQAEYHLAVMYLKGDGGMPLPTIATMQFEKLYRELCARPEWLPRVLGSTKFYLGVIYQNRKGGPQLDQQAERLFEEVIDERSSVPANQRAEAKFYLAIMYEDNRRINGLRDALRLLADVIQNPATNPGIRACARLRRAAINHENGWLQAAEEDCQIVAADRVAPPDVRRTAEARLRTLQPRSDATESPEKRSRKDS